MCEGAGGFWGRVKGCERLLRRVLRRGPVGLLHHVLKRGPVGVLRHVLRRGCARLLRLVLSRGLLGAALCSEEGV